MDDDDASSKRARLSNDALDEEDESKYTKGTWSKDEDDRLVQAVELHGTDNWKAVAGMVAGRSAKQCRDRYKLKLDPTINHGPWTKAEDDKLLELAAEYGRAWTKIAKNMPGRTENAVKSRISSLERIKTKDWSQEEDTLLIELRRKGIDYEKMTKHFPSRSSHAIKKRWETLHMDELTKKLKQEITPSVQNSPGASVTTSQPSSGQFNLASSQTTTSSSPTIPEAVPLGNQHQQHQTLAASMMAANAMNMMGMGYGGSALQLPPFQPMMPMMQPQKYMPMPPQPNVHPGVQNSRLKHHSTSMTVLLQVLGNTEMATMQGASPLRSNGSTLRDHSSFSLAPPAQPSGPSSEGSTPAQDFLQYLLSSKPADQ